MTTCIRTIAIVSLGVTLLFSVTPAASIPVAQGSCEPTAVKYKASKTPVTSTSTDFVTVSDTTISFVQGGTRASCVLVLFSAEAGAAAGEEMFLRAVLDGATECQPSQHYFVRSESPPLPRAMHYVCANVPPGRHTITIQYQSSNGNEVLLHYRTIIVHYVK